MARQFTEAPLAISFFGSSFYERYTRKNALKIPVNTGNFNKKEIHFQAFSTILFRVSPDSYDSLKVLKNLLLASSRSRMFYKIVIPKYFDAANGSASRNF